MGAVPFRTRGIKNAATETSLASLIASRALSQTNLSDLLCQQNPHLDIIESMSAVSF
jgi:hypothetical protein